MAASTVEELQSDLDESLSWRRIELQVLRSQVQGIEARTEKAPASRAALRSSVVLLYAHWEGFTKHACQSYLDFVAIRRLRYDELCLPLAMTAVGKLARASNTDAAKLASLTELVVGDGANRAAVPRKNVVETGSNLRYERLVGILDALGLDTGPFATSGNFIDTQLCDGRNDIAHGKDSFPDKAAVEALHDRVISLMDEVRSLVVTAAATQSYLASDEVQ